MPLLQVLRQPDTLATLTRPQWDVLIRQARRAMVLGRLAALARAHGLIDRLPPEARRHLTAGLVTADHHARITRWEVQRITEALQPDDIPFVLLKGAAYIVSDLPPGRGRLAADVDILVPAERLADTEAALKAHGWRFGELDAYDERYYRQWTHELPPMHHPIRHTTLDVHHTILPVTGRVHPDPKLLLAESVPLSGDDCRGPRRLSIRDMILHSAAHLFHEGEMHAAIRDLADLDALMRHGAEQSPDFWPGLIERGRQLNLQRSLYYTLRLTSRCFDTPVPSTTLTDARRDAPNEVVGRIMDMLLMQVSRPSHPDRPKPAKTLAEAILYLRGHWLRMPLRLLLPHLWYKTRQRLLASNDDSTDDARAEPQV